MKGKTSEEAANELAATVSRKVRLQQELKDLEAKEEKLKADLEQKRECALYILAGAAIRRIRETSLEITNLEEGSDLTATSVMDSRPWPGQHQTAVQLYSARSRKGYVDTSDAVEARNPSYLNDEMIVVQFVFPREDFEEELQAVSKTTIREKGNQNVR